MLAQTIKRVQPHLGTFVEITLQGPLPFAQLEQSIQTGFAAIAQIDRLMSFHNKTSDLSRLNRAPAKTAVRVHRRTIAVLKAANALFKLSAGSFDIRCGAMLVKKGLLPKNGVLPRLSPLQKKGAPFKIEGTSVRKTGAWTLDLGGIAKGYAVDYAVKTIQRLTRGHAISGTVNAGGDLRTWGREIPVTARMDGLQKSWMRTFSVQQTALATSSGRQSGNMEALAPAAHIRMPAQRVAHSQQTAVVFARDCAMADALTKVVLLAPQNIAQKCLTRHNARALVFRANGTLSHHFPA